MYNIIHIIFKNIEMALGGKKVSHPCLETTFLVSILLGKLTFYTLPENDTENSPKVLIMSRYILYVLLTHIDVI